MNLDAQELFPLCFGIGLKSSQEAPLGKLAGRKDGRTTPHLLTEVEISSSHQPHASRICAPQEAPMRIPRLHPLRSRPVPPRTPAPIKEKVA